MEGINQNYVMYNMMMDLRKHDLAPPAAATTTAAATTSLSASIINQIVCVWALCLLLWPSGRRPASLILLWGEVRCQAHIFSH